MEQFLLTLPWSTEPSPAEQQYRQAGLQRTIGTHFVLPPPEAELICAFQTKHKDSQMTVGSKALCKHHARQTDHPFWESPAGSPSAKNEAALRCLMLIMKDAVWRNVHMLANSNLVYEIRNSDTYGVRWLIQPKTAFWGFLEQQTQHPT